MNERLTALRRGGDGNLLIYAESETDSDLYYATQFLVPDPVAYLELNGEKILLVKSLEYGRAGDQAQVDRVVSTSPFEEELRARDEHTHWTRLLDLFLESQATKVEKQFAVPANFPLGSAERLRELGYQLTVCPSPLFPERTVKTPEEAEAIERSQRGAEACMEFVIDLLRRSEIRGDLLHLDGQLLTAERTRFEAHKFLLDLGLVATNTIIAGGDQGCDGHHRGSGPLPAHKTIVIDIFPRCVETRYWGDLTRTVVRGEISDAVRRLYRDVLEAQEAALALLRDGQDGENVHRTVVDLFEAQGNPSVERDGRKTGFIHSTGHGVGLDIHEAPSVGRLKSPLKTGHVVTIEPGLYYPGVGAVRIEDLVVITADGHRNLTRLPKDSVDVCN